MRRQLDLCSLTRARYLDRLLFFNVTLIIEVPSLTSTTTELLKRVSSAQKTKFRLLSRSPILVPLCCSGLSGILCLKLTNSLWWRMHPSPLILFSLPGLRAIFLEEWSNGSVLLSLPKVGVFMNLSSLLSTSVNPSNKQWIPRNVNAGLITFREIRCTQFLGAKWQQRSREPSLTIRYSRILLYVTRRIILQDMTIVLRWEQQRKPLVWMPPPKLYCSGRMSCGYPGGLLMQSSCCSAFSI